MGWSIKLFDVGGTAVRIHLTFFLLLAWIAAIDWTKGGPAEALDGVLERMPQKPAQEIVVVGVVDPQQRLLGYVTAENLAELVMIQSSRSTRVERAAAA